MNNHQIPYPNLPSKGSKAPSTIISKELCPPTKQQNTTLIWNSNHLAPDTVMLWNTQHPGSNVNLTHTPNLMTLNLTAITILNSNSNQSQECTLRPRYFEFFKHKEFPQYMWELKISELNISEKKLNIDGHLVSTLEGCGF